MMLSIPDPWNLTSSRNFLSTEYVNTDPNVSKYNLQAYVGYPVSLGNERLGSLCIVYQENVDFHRKDIAFLGTAAKAIGVEEMRLRFRTRSTESEERLDAILETVQTGIIVIDAEAHTIEDLNQAAVSIIGAEKEEILGRGCTEFNCGVKPGECPITGMGEKAGQIRKKAR